MNTEKKHLPSLRFPEFMGDGEWLMKKIGDISTSFTGSTPIASKKEYYGGNIPFIRSGEIDNDHTTLSLTQLGLDNSSAKIVEKGTLLYALYGATSGEVAISKIRGAINQAILAIIPHHDENSAFIFHYLKHNKESIVNNYIQGGQGNLSGAIINALPITIPSLAEQSKIADCLSSIDSYISSINEKIEQLKAHKKSLMQKLFPQNGQTIPEYRFPEFEKNGAWTEKKLGEYLVEHKMKSDGQCEVYSVSVSKGVVNQIDYLGRSFSASDTSKYKLVKPFDVIYTKSPTGSFPYGIIKQSFIDHNVIVSPLYGVFSPLNKYIGYIIHSYFESPERTNNYLVPIIKKGAKNTIQVSNDTFLSRTVCFPSDVNEQRKIAESLYTITKTTDLFYSKMELLRLQKKGLMQLLFPSSK